MRTRRLWIPLLFIGLPLLELYILVLFARATSVWAAVGFIVGSALLGALLVRSQGLAVLRRLRDNLLHGRLPEDVLVDGLLVLLGGALLVMPSFITDVLGLILLNRRTRRPTRRWLIRRIESRFGGPDGPIGGRGPRHRDVEFEVRED